MSMHLNTGPHLLFTLLATLFIVMSRPVWSQEVSSPLHSDLSRAYGYYNGQKLSIERIQKKYPALAAKASQAQMEFDLLFKSSHENIEKELHRMLGQRRADYKSQLHRQLFDRLESSPLDQPQAEAFIREVRLRAKGQIESPVLETVLTYNPDFQNNPAKEVLSGFSSTYRTQKHPKAKGVDFQIQYPRSWRAKEGQRPNVIQLITSENGRGFENIVLLVKDIPLPAGYRMTNQDLDEFFSPKALREMVPDGASVIAAKSVVMDRQKAGMILFDHNLQRVDATIFMRNLHFVTVYKDKMIFVQCMIASPSADRTELNERFKKIEPLFKLVANSFVLQSQY
jgi:hypothetical protein